MKCADGNHHREHEVRSGRVRGWYFRGDRKQQVVEHVSAIERDLEGVAGSLAETALQFCLTHPAVSTVIPGMRRIATVESSTSVSDRGPLAAEVLAILRPPRLAEELYC